jgi:rhodanese-related sulfurtransferase
MSINRITPLEASERLQSDKTWTYLDVRSAMEFAKGHAPGAVNIPLLNYSDSSSGLQPNPRFMEIVQKRFDTSASLVVACAAGGRSLRAAHELQGAGYSNVVDMLGGFSGKRSPMGGFEQQGWVQNELPVSTATTDCETYRTVLDNLKE